MRRGIALLAIMFLSGSAYVPIEISKNPYKDIVFEIGGRGKGRSQFKGVKTQRKIIFADGYDLTDLRRPLFLAGML